MAINKVGSKGIADGSVAAIDFAPNSVTSDKLTDGTITNANLSNSSVTVAGTSIALGASGTLNNKFIDWQSVVVSDGSTVTTMVAGNGYFVNNTSAAGLVKLPISASIGDVVAIKDYAGNFGTNSLTIQRNGHNIQGVANDSLISTNRASLVLVYVDSTKGWLYWEEHNVADLQNILLEATGGTVTESGDYKIHAFTGDGCFVVSSISPNSPGDVDYVVVAGGGGGSWSGGGAGGYRTGSCAGCTGLPISASPGTYPVTVGGGGPGGATGSTGSNSVFSTITSAGGGRGGSFSNCSPTKSGGSGGSGGGGGGNLHATQGSGGSGNTPPVSPPQGNPGAKGSTDQATFTNGGGGGGAATAGSGGNPNPDTSPSPSVGGSGSNAHTPYFGSAPQPFYTTPTGHLAGGGGGTNQSPGSQAAGGTGGGGNGCSPVTPTGSTGTANTGGGGGYQKAGGKGIVLIRYKFR